MDITNLAFKTKQVLNSNLDITDSNSAFLFAMFPFIEDVDTAELLTICNESFPAYNIKLNGFFINEDESLINIYCSYFDENANADTNLTINELNIMKTGMENIIKQVKKNELNKLNETSITFDLCDFISRYPNYEIMVNVVTNCNVPKNLYQLNSNYQIDGANVGFRVYDQKDLLLKIENVEVNNNTLDLLKEFNQGINAVLIFSDKDVDVYLTYFKGEWLAKLYSKESTTLLSANVRSYLKRTNKVNAQIIDTVKYAPTDFVAYNNGISSVASAIEASKINDSFYVINKITNFLIVNGGQTTATLNECKNDGLDLNEVLVPVKLTVIKNNQNIEELINDISIYSNTQTAIKKSDPPSNLKFYKLFEELSKTILAKNKFQEYCCFFERTNGQYNTLKRINSKDSNSFSCLYPSKMKFTKLQLAQAIVSWEQMPNIVCMGQEKNFQFFNSNVKYFKDIDANYFKNSYSLILLYRRLNQLIVNKKLPYKSNLIAYTMAFISYKYSKNFNFKEIWDNQGVPNSFDHVLNEIIEDVYSKLIDSPSSYPDIRMWARKIECWENIKTINREYNFNFAKETYDFLPKNDAKSYIDIEGNLKNASLWKILSQWNNEKNFFNKRQKTFILAIPTLIYKELNGKKKMTKKQCDYAKDVFLLAVQNGFNYSEIK